MDRAAAELFLASLFVESTPERIEAVRNTAKTIRNWEGLQSALEGHGVLTLFLRNLDLAGVELPPAIAPMFRARSDAQRDDDQRSRLTLQRFLAAAARERLELTLVGGSALFLDLYPEPLRRAGELEFLVPPEHLGRALAAGRQAGLLLDERALPAWWYRRTQAPLPLAPSSSMLCGVSLRCRLHHPSLLLTALEPELLARRRRSTFEGHALYRMDPIDGLLELSVRMATQAGEALHHGRRHLLAAASNGQHSLRLDRLLDLRTHIECRHGELPVGEVLVRAREWSAEPALRAILDCIQMGLGFLPATREWARSLAQGLASAASGPNGTSSALFHPDPIERLPQWLRPSDAFLARRYALPPQSSTNRLRLARVRHLAEVFGAGANAGFCFPLALLTRRLARSARRAAWSGAQTPQHMSDMTAAWREAAARVERQKPIAPRTISLPTSEESVKRYPDRYLG